MDIYTEPTCQRKKQIHSRKGQQEDGTEVVLMYEKNL